MKVLNPPAIGNLDELLDLLLHPDKYAKYLKQLQDVRDSIKTQLETYNTKEKADEFLAQAQDAQAEAQRVLNSSKETFKDNDARCMARLDEIAREQDAWTKAKEIEKAELKAKRDALTDEAAALREAEADVNARELTLQQRTAELDKLSAKLTAELEKMEQRKALLNAV